jgi:serine/threonine-protein kinase RsbW
VHPGHWPDKEAQVSEVVDLAIPAQANLIVLARLTAATVAARAEFGVEEIEDIRLAVEELCLPYIGAAREGRLQLRFERDGDLIEISCSLVASADEHRSRAALDDEASELEELSGRILDALVDEHGRDSVDGQDRGWLRKRRAESAR